MTFESPQTGVVQEAVSPVGGVFHPDHSRFTRHQDVILCGRGTQANPKRREAVYVREAFWECHAGLLLQFYECGEIVCEWELHPAESQCGRVRLPYRLLAVEADHCVGDVVRDSRGGRIVVGAREQVAREVSTARHQAATPLRQCGAHEAPACIAPSLDVASPHHDQIDCEAHASEFAAQAYRLGRRVLDLGADNQQVEIAASMRISACVGTEENHLGAWRGCDQAPCGLEDHCLVDHQLRRQSTERL